MTWLAETLSRVGQIFVQLLKLAVPPLVLTAVLVSVANLRNVNGAARLAAKTLMWFLITAAVSVALAIGLGLLIDPGRGVTLDTGAARAPEHAGTWLDFVTGILPTNVVTAFTEVNVLQIVFLGAVLGAAALAAGEKAEPALALARSVLELVQKALWWVIRLAPIGTAGLIGKAVSTYGWDLLAPLAKFSAAAAARRRPGRDTAGAGAGRGLTRGTGRRARPPLRSVRGGHQLPRSVAHVVRRRPGEPAHDPRLVDPGTGARGQGRLVLGRPDDHPRHSRS
ncbi:Proton glutamate symport protein [Nonomuraea coxensis DSM 45129]|uniref:Proton glutamate symport protein n=1 Tax=Nonomuraea coxensis DSM 45129 TaxID=1122611 RepID=A0ABX8TYW9_9ACTN|nr:Proton glutamate symport protein [Nonomuraea coxensis DSM 45129]